MDAHPMLNAVKISVSHDGMSKIIKIFLIRLHQKYYFTFQTNYYNYQLMQMINNKKIHPYLALLIFLHVLEKTEVP